MRRLRHDKPFISWFLQKKRKQRMGDSDPGELEPIAHFVASSLSIPAEFTFSRPSVGNFLAADGRMTATTAGNARFECDKDGNLKGLLLEPQSVNQNWPSPPADSSRYLLSNVTVASEASTLSHGSDAAVTCSALDGEISYSTANAYVSPEDYAISWIVKPTTDFLQVGCSSNVSLMCVNFDFTSVASSIIAGTGSVINSAFIEELTNGYFRIGFNFTSSLTAVANFYVSFANSLTSARLETYTGNVGDTFNVAYVQHESILSSVINSSTTTALRAADSLTTTLPDTGTIYRSYILNGVQTSEYVDVSEGLLPANFTGYVLELKVYDKVLTDEEKV